MNGCKQCPAFDKCTATYRGSACAALRWSYGIDTDPEIVNTTDREKLIELLKNAPHFEQMYQTTWQEAMAGWLINNGVTFAKDTNVPSKWISVTERLPEGLDKVLVLFENGTIMDAQYEDCIDDESRFGTYRGYYDPDTLGFVDGEWIPYEGVTHWMPLPEAPKEE